jgi:hypothetical protein
MQTIESNGLSKMDNTRIKQVLTVKTTLLNNGLTIEENSQIKRIKTLTQNGNNKGHKNAGAKYWKLEQNNNIIGIFWTKDLKIYLFKTLSKKEINILIKNNHVHCFDITKSSRYDYFNQKSIIII